MKHSPHARAIRDVEDEELQSFFHGMSPWQVFSVIYLLYLGVAIAKNMMFLQLMLIVTASSIGEELFYRVAVQVIPWYNKGALFLLSIPTVNDDIEISDLLLVQIRSLFI